MRTRTGWAAGYDHNKELVSPLPRGPRGSEALILPGLPGYTQGVESYNFTQEEGKGFRRRGNY